MKHIKPAVKKYGKEIPIPRLIKDVLDNKNKVNHPNRYENHRVNADTIHWDLTEGDDKQDAYRDELTDAYDLLKVMCGYNYDQFLEGEHISRIHQEYGID